MAVEDLPGYPGLATLVESLIIKMEQAQAQYFLDHQKFFQGLDLVDGEPNGQNRESANTTNKPGDQEHSWKTFDPVVFGAVMSLPMNMRSDVYQSPDGWGYKLFFEFYRDGLGPDGNGTDGRHWMKTHHEKPDGTSETSEWFIIPEAP